MTFEEILDHAIAMLQRRERLTYSTLKRQFQLDDATLDDLKHELIEGQRLAVDERNNVLVWIGATDPASPSPPPTLVPKETPERLPLSPAFLAGERRQVTVLFADISGFTALAETMDPEDVRQVMNACFARLVPLVEDYGGTIDKFIGDEIMALFGAPIAHDNDAERAGRTALAMMEVLHAFNAEQGTTLGLHCGINTGMVIAGGIGTPARQDYSVMGDAVNLAARLGDASERGQIFVGPETYRLTTALFTFERLEPMRVKGKAEPVQVYCVLGLRDTQSCPDAGGPLGRVPLVGRDAEVTLLLDLWNQVKEGRGQVVVLTGEPGIGKSRLVQEIQEQVAGEPSLRWECRCSPYYQNTAMYPIIELLEQVCHFQPGETPMEQVAKLERTLEQYRLPLEGTIPLCTLLLSLPLPEDRYAPLSLSPQRQRRKTMELVLELVVRHTIQYPVLFIIEDVQWSDPSTLEFLDLLITQEPTAALFTLLTCRPEFQAPWRLRSYITPLVLQRLRQAQVETLVEWITHGKPLLPTIRQHIVTQTDGIPLFVEELIKEVLESDILIEGQDGYTLRDPVSTAIPATLQGTLMARLDHVGTAKGIAQLGATIGRQFSYTLLNTIAHVEEATLQRELRRLVDAELLYQRSLPPHATYLFKHALIQEAAYRSLLRSTRQYYHQQIAQVLEERFPETAESQPEVLAQHYTAAGLPQHAVFYWLHAGQMAYRRFAHHEAIGHLRHGLTLLEGLPEGPERAQAEVGFQAALGLACAESKGYASPEVEQAYSRAQALCQQLGNAPQAFPVRHGLFMFHLVRGHLELAHTFGTQLLTAGETIGDGTLRLVGQSALGIILWHMGRAVDADSRLIQALALYDRDRHTSLAAEFGQDLGVVSGTYHGIAQLGLGFPDSALHAVHTAVALARALKHPLSLCFALAVGTPTLMLRHDPLETVLQWAEECMAVSAEQGFPFWLAKATVYKGWALGQQGQAEEGLAYIHQGIAGWQAVGAGLVLGWYFGVLADTYLAHDRPEQALTATEDAMQWIHTNAEYQFESFVRYYQGKAWLALQRTTEAEACFRQAINVAQHQAAKWWELRATTGLARLWQRQGKTAAACDILAPVYGWFTEGLDTADLQEAKALLDQLQPTFKGLG